MSCNEAMKKLHFYYNPPLPPPNVTNVTIVNETNNTNGTVTVTLSNGSVINTNDTESLIANLTAAAENFTLGGIPKVDRYNFFTFVSGDNPEDAADGGSYPLKVFFDSMQPHFFNQSKIESDFYTWNWQDMVIELGSTYQVCWQQTDGTWWAAFEDRYVQGPYFYNISSIPLMGHPFVLDFAVMLHPDLCPPGAQASCTGAHVPAGLK